MKWACHQLAAGLKARIYSRHMAAQSVFLNVCNNEFLTQIVDGQPNAVGDHHLTDHLDWERKRMAGLIPG